MRVLVACNPANICIGITNVLWHDVYVYCLIGILLVTMINILIMDSVPQHMEIVIIIISLVLKWGCILILCKMLFKYLFLADLKPILCLYVSKIIAFADIYLLAYRINPSSFSLPNPNAILTMTFINYSVSCQTLTGISSVSPKSILAEVLTVTQLLLLGISYDIFILSIVVLRFCEPEEEMDASMSSKCSRHSHIPSRRFTYGTRNDKIMNTPRRLYRVGTFTDSIIYTPLKSGKSSKSSSYKRLRSKRADTTVVSSGWELNKTDEEDDFGTSEPKSDTELTELTGVSGVTAMSKSLSLSFFPDLNILHSDNVIDSPTRKHIYERNRWMGQASVKWVYKHMTFMLLVTESPRLVAMYFTCDDGLLVVGIILDTMLMILSLFGVAMKISLIHTLPQDVKVNITIRSLLRVYLTLVLLFGILQFDIWVITKDTTHPAFAVDVATVDIERYWLMVWHFMFLSVATFTNAGVGDNISELSELGQSVNNLQMLVALLFNVVVFGVGLLRLGEEREKAMEKFVDQEILQIRKKRSEKKNAISYLSIGKSAPALETIQEIVRKKSNVLRKQGLLPGVVTPLFTLARKHTMAKQNKRYESCYHSL
eukprot:798172_1